MDNKTHIITIPFIMPSLNDYIKKTRSNKFLGAKQKKDIERQIIYSLTAKQRALRIKNPVFIKIDFYEPNKKRDKDNVSFGKKFILDAFVKCGILVNDGWNEIIGFNEQFYHSKNNGKIVVTLIECE